MGNTITWFVTAPGVVYAGPVGCFSQALVAAAVAGGRQQSPGLRSCRHCCVELSSGSYRRRASAACVTSCFHTWVQILQMFVLAYHVAAVLGCPLGLTGGGPLLSVSAAAFTHKHECWSWVLSDSVIRDVAYGLTGGVPLLACVTSCFDM